MDSNISVIICAYTEKRWNELIAAITSVQCQTLRPKDIIVVIDRNPKLQLRVKEEVPNIVVLENSKAKGASGARNSGALVAQGTILAFLDDDAIAHPNWLKNLAGCYVNPSVVGVGGKIEPYWSEKRPFWFPSEFYWVVGCTYRGMPTADAPVRNVIGANMSVRKQAFERVQGFRESFGNNKSQVPITTRSKWFQHSAGDEETEFCMRVSKSLPNSIWLYTPSASVKHCVPVPRMHLSYFLWRCYDEGLGKALLAHLHGTKESLSSERAYTSKTLPQGIIRELTTALIHIDPSGFARAGTIILGLATTIIGYLMGSTLAPLTNSGRKFSSDVQASHFAPVRIVEIEIGRPLQDIAAFDEITRHHYQQARCLIRLHTQPLGIVDFFFNSNGLSAAVCAQKIWQDLHTQINGHLQEDGLPIVTELTAAGLSSVTLPTCLKAHEIFFAHAPFVSIIISTRNRTEQLTKCLPTLVKQHYPHYEIIIVDNAPSSNATAELIKDHYSHVPYLRYVREDVPGLSIGLNRGIMEARGEILAFTDDDVVVDAYWLLHLAKAFNSTDDVACVTGLVLPRELETPAQFWFEEFGGFSKGFRRRIYDMGANRPTEPLYPYTAGQFGTGANMAFRRVFLKSVGGFDAALQCGMDIAAFFQVVRRGYKLVYEPAAVVHHIHRREYKELQKQLYSYGAALTAYLTKNILDSPQLFFEFMIKIPYGLFFALSTKSPKNNKKSLRYPRSLTLLELKGMCYGPIAYIRRRRKRIDTSELIYSLAQEKVAI